MKKYTKTLLVLSILAVSTYESKANKEHDVVVKNLFMFVEMANPIAYEKYYDQNIKRPSLRNLLEQAEALEKDCVATVRKRELDEFTGEGKSWFCCCKPNPKVVNCTMAQYLMQQLLQHQIGYFDGKCSHTREAIMLLLERQQDTQELFYASGDSPIRISLLHGAAILSDYEMMWMLVRGKRSDQIDSKNSLGETPLQKLLEINYLRCQAAKPVGGLESGLERNERCIKLLLDCGANPDVIITIMGQGIKWSFRALDWDGNPRVKAMLKTALKARKR